MRLLVIGFLLEGKKTVHHKLNTIPGSIKETINFQGKGNHLRIEYSANFHIFA